MLAIQSWLKANNGQFDLLEKQLGIKSTFHPVDDRVILNYDMIASPKAHPIVLDCRGLVLNKKSYDIIARAFHRFFNLGEVPDINSHFVWEGCTAQEKCDGSLILSYWYNNDYHINTRGSFGDGEINKSGITWKELFKLAFTNGDIKQHVCWPQLNTSILVWELCSRYNKIVRDYPSPTLYLLSAFSLNGDELSREKVDQFAECLGVRRPEGYTFNNADDVFTFLEEKGKTDPTFEGVVLRDKNNLRIKCKQDKYLLLHRTVNNYALNTERILDIILTFGSDEFLLYYPELKDKVKPIEDKIMKIRSEIVEIWPKVKDIEIQKDFALSISHLPYKGILFQARKFGKNPVDLITVNSLLSLFS